MEGARILIADDASFMRQELKRILEEDEDTEVVGEARDGIEVVELFEKLKPEIVFMEYDQ